MTLTKETFDIIPAGVIIREVLTKYHNVEPHGANLRFVVVKGENNDWAIYHGFQDQPTIMVMEQGIKLQDQETIMGIMPCTFEVYKLYRK